MSHTVNTTVFNAIKMLFTDLRPAFKEQCKRKDVEYNLQTILSSTDTGKILRRISVGLHPDKFQQKGTPFTEADNERFTLFSNLMTWWTDEVKPLIEANDVSELNDIKDVLELAVPAKPTSKKPAPAPAPPPAPAPAPKTQQKRNKTCRSTNPHTNFHNYRKKWISDTAQDPAHDLTEADCEVILDVFLGYAGWKKDDTFVVDGVQFGQTLPMDVFRKCANGAKTRINNLVKQRLMILGKRTDGSLIHRILMD